MIIDPANPLLPPPVQPAADQNISKSPAPLTPPEMGQPGTPGARASRHDAPSDRVSINVQIPKKNLEFLQQFGQLGDFLNTLATNLRKTHEGLAASAEAVKKMKEPLDIIIKNYPPFNIESKERMELLMSYSSLQKEIKKLMIPPPPPPVYEKVEHLWEGLFSGKDGTIPATDLPVDAPDSHVKLAAVQLESFSSQIGIIGEELSKSITTL